MNAQIEHALHFEDCIVTGCRLPDGHEGQHDLSAAIDLLDRLVADPLNPELCREFGVEIVPVAPLPTPPPATSSAHLDRDEAIKRIKTALKSRSGKSWSVTGGRGTAWGWIKIDTMPARKRFDWDGNPTDSDFGYMSKEEQSELAALLGVGRMHPQGVDIPSGSYYREEYVARAEGRTPERFGEQYWD